MTCIVAVSKNGNVRMGGDRCASGGGRMQIVKHPKVFKKGDMLFGYTTSFRFGQIIEYIFEIPEHSEGVSNMEYMVKTFIPSLRECLSNNKYTDDTSKGESGTMIVGYRGEVFTIFGDWQVFQSDSGYSAVGSGELYALGSLSTTHRQDLTGMDMVELALNAAAEHANTVCGPFDIIKL